MLLATACSTTKYVPEGEYLLSHVKVQTYGRMPDGHLHDMKYSDINTSNLKNYVRQQENARWFSLFKLPLATYSLSGRDTTKWINRTLRNMGEAPVLYDSAQARLTCADLRQELQNEGYLDATVDLMREYKGKRIDVTYMLSPGEPYFLRNVRYEIADPEIALFLKGDSLNRLLAEGQKFEVSRLDLERQRITQLLTNHGYFRFHKEFISYFADTTAHSRLIDLTLHLGLNRRADKPDELHRLFRIGKVTYASGDAADPRIHLRQHVLEECTHLAEGELYSADNLQATYNHFSRMQAVKYTNISLTERPDTALLDCNIQLQTNKPSTISFQPEGTNTAGDLGAAATLTYQNRNLFRGSEQLTIELRGAFEAIKGLEGYANQNFVEYSAEVKLGFPRFIAPFIGGNTRRQINATSELSLLYDLQNRPEFHRRLLSGAWRYKWNPIGARHRFQLDLIDLNYVFMPWISTTFREQYLDNESNRNAILRYNYEDLFIMKLGFGYTYSDGTTSVRTNIETAGNLLNAGSRIFGQQKDGQGQYRLFNIAFAQYVKGDIDFTHSLQVDRNNQVVFHFGLGLAWPYGNSKVLPFEKRYFSGGANSVRGWSVRSLGPGKYKESDGRINFINQTGDMKLDLNVEYRTHLFWKLGGAIFIDAGNIWTLREYENQPGGQFKLTEFAKQLAVSYGLGLRFNFDYFVLRFDLGMKAINPAYEIEDEEHFPIIHPRFSRDFAFHFAVGLPF